MENTRPLKTSVANGQLHYPKRTKEFPSKVTDGNIFKKLGIFKYYDIFSWDFASYKELELYFISDMQHEV